MWNGKYDEDVNGTMCYDITGDAPPDRCEHDDMMLLYDAQGGVGSHDRETGHMPRAAPLL
eukprot:8540056-Pyramimonas_sp.AAC.1